MPEESRRKMYASLSKTLSGTVFVNHPDHSKSLRIQNEDLHLYLAKGWSKGRAPSGKQSNPRKSKWCGIQIEITFPDGKQETTFDITDWSRNNDLSNNLTVILRAIVKNVCVKSGKLAGYLFQKVPLVD